MELQPNILFHNRYRLIEKKGSGSFGEVWLARDEQTGIEVAVKIYIALDDRGVEEFRAEYKTAFALNHPHLLHANFFDVCEQRPYLVMQYCPSSAVSLVGAIDEQTVWKFIRDVADGLAYLHEQDVVHRDIKPDNILRDSNGRFLITDFGLSLRMRSTLRRNSARQKNTDNVAGAIGYMAPEMFSAKPQAVKATDIWALGVTIYEIATGEMPFFGQGGVMELHGAELPELPNKYSKELEQLMIKCLAKEPWDRPTASNILEVASHHINNNGNAKTVSYEKYKQEISTLKKIIKNDRAKYEQLQYFYNTAKEQADAKIAKKASKKSTIWACITTITTILFIITTLIVTDSKNYYHSINSHLQRKLDVIATFMKDTPILVNNISVWNDGEKDKDIIYSKNTTYIYHSADFVNIKGIVCNEEILIKFITPYGISTGKESPSGYSYTETIMLTPFEVSTYTSSGWGSETKGHWRAGRYRIEYWYGGKCIGSKAFTIK